MSPEKDRITPLATAAVASYRTSSSDEEDPANWRGKGASPGCSRRRWVRCCGCCAAAAVVALAVLLVVGFTVYRVREPQMTMNSVAISNISVAPPNVSLTVVADVSVKNRNPATFYFDTSLTSLYYHDTLVGTARGPSGRSAGRRTFRMNVTLDVVSDQLLSNPGLLAEVQSGTLGMNSSTAVGGHVMVFGLFRHHVDVLMNCTVTVAVANQTILNQFSFQICLVSCGPESNSSQSKRGQADKTKSRKLSEPCTGTFFVEKNISLNDMANREKSNLPKYLWNWNQHLKNVALLVSHLPMQPENVTNK